MTQLGVMYRQEVVLYMAKEYYYDGDYVTIWGDVKDQPDFVIVTDGSDYGELSVVRRSNLVPKEESYRFKKEQERAEELRLITAKAKENFDELVDKVVDDAIRTLTSRMKFNAFFGKGGAGAAAWAMSVVEELEKIIKKDAKEIVEKGPFD